MLASLLLAAAIKAEAAVTFRVVIPERIGAGVVQVDRAGPAPPVQVLHSVEDGRRVVTMASP